MNEAKKLMAIAVLIFISSPVLSQDTLLNKYGLWVINDAEILKKTIAANPAKKMIPVSAMIPSAIIDLKYADTLNFMHTKFYPAKTTTYLRRSALIALTYVQQALLKQGLCIRIWDAYRPYSVTEKMWEQVMDDRYAANPASGSGHNRGISVDLTITDLSTGKDLDMGTGFDNFSDTAHHDFKDLPAQVIQNRLLLRTLMEKHGFIALETEWWHYYLPDSKTYELLDISFEELSRIE